MALSHGGVDHAVDCITTAVIVTEHAPPRFPDFHGRTGTAVNPKSGTDIQTINKSLSLTLGRLEQVHCHCADLPGSLSSRVFHDGLRGMNCWGSQSKRQLWMAYRWALQKPHKGTDQASGAHCCALEKVYWKKFCFLSPFPMFAAKCFGSLKCFGMF